MFLTAWPIPEIETELEIDQILAVAVTSAIEKLPTLTRRDDEGLEDTIRRTVRSCLKSTTGTRPLIDVEIVRIPTNPGTQIGSDDKRAEEVLK